MTLLKPLTNSAVTLVTDAATFNIFEKGSGDTAITLLSSPEEEVSKGTISWPGEYDMQGVLIRGIGHDEGSRVSFVLTIDNVRIACLSAPLHDWNDHELELLGDVDVFVTPTGDAKLVQKLVDEIDPRILVPLQTGEDASFSEILKSMGAQDVEPVAEYKLKGSLPSEGREVVVLQ